MFLSSCWDHFCFLTWRVGGRPFIVYIPEVRGVKTPYDFRISVMSKKSVQEGEGGQILSKIACIMNE